MAGFSLLPYLTKQSDPFSAVLAGKLQAQKQRNDTVKWLANYQMQLQRMQMSKAASDRAQQVHDARMKALRGQGSGQRNTLGVSGLNSQVASPQHPAHMRQPPAGYFPNGFGPQYQTLPGQGLMPQSFDPTRFAQPSPFNFGTDGTLKGPSFRGYGPLSAPANRTDRVPNPYNYAPPAPAATDTGLDTMQGFSDAGSFATDRLDAGVDTKLAALDEDPYAEADEDDDYPNPFSAFA